MAIITFHLRSVQRIQWKGMLGVPWLAVSLREWFARTRSTFISKRTSLLRVDRLIRADSLGVTDRPVLDYESWPAVNLQAIKAVNSWHIRIHKRLIFSGFFFPISFHRRIRKRILIQDQLIKGKVNRWSHFLLEKKRISQGLTVIPLSARIIESSFKRWSGT